MVFKRVHDGDRWTNTVIEPHSDGPAAHYLVALEPDVVHGNDPRQVELNLVLCTSKPHDDGFKMIVFLRADGPKAEFLFFGQKLRIL